MRTCILSLHEWLAQSDCISAPSPALSESRTVPGGCSYRRMSSQCSRAHSALPVADVSYLQLTAAVAQSVNASQGSKSGCQTIGSRTGSNSPSTRKSQPTKKPAVSISLTSLYSLGHLVKSPSWLLFDRANIVLL